MVLESIAALCFTLFKNVILYMIMTPITRWMWLLLEHWKAIMTVLLWVAYMWATFKLSAEFSSIEYQFLVVYQEVGIYARVKVMLVTFIKCFLWDRLSYAVIGGKRQMCFVHHLSIFSFYWTPVGFFIGSFISGTLTQPHWRNSQNIDGGNWRYGKLVSATSTSENQWKNSN